MCVCVCVYRIDPSLTMSIPNEEHRGDEEEEEERRASGDSARAQWLGRPFMADPEYFDYFYSEDEEEDEDGTNERDLSEENGNDMNGNYSPIATNANRLPLAGRETSDVITAPDGQQPLRPFSEYPRTPHRTPSSVKIRGRPSISSTPRVSPLTPGVSAQKDMDKLEEQWKGLIYSKVSSSVGDILHVSKHNPIKVNFIFFL